MLIARYSTKVNTKLVAQLRKQVDISLSKAKEALIKTNNNYDDALKWLAENESLGAASKANKLADRDTVHGLIAIQTVGQVTRMVELNCETDFVAKSTLFTQLALQCAQQEKKDLNDEITLAIGKLGENIRWRRDIALTGHVGWHVHSDQALPQGLGRLGTLVQFSGQVGPWAKKLAQHITGFNPPDVDTLLEQPFLFGGGSVRQVLEQQSSTSPIQIQAFHRWECGQGLEKKTESFAEEVARQLQ